jgi:hypothetical protein
MAERPVAYVPIPILALLGVALAGQIAMHARLGPPEARAEDMHSPPAENVLRLASVGEPQALAALLMLHIQAFDYQPGTRVPYGNLDYDRLAQWLERIVALDPAGQYPLLIASRVYADVGDPVKVRRMLEMIYGAYLADPDRRWPWLAHAALIAKHRLKDLPLARKYAVALQTHTKDPAAPLWVKQMEPFILEDMNELESARVLLGGLIASGQVKDERDLRLLEEHLKAIEARIDTDTQKNPSERRRQPDKVDERPSSKPVQNP